MKFDSRKYKLFVLQLNILEMSTRGSWVGSGGAGGRRFGYPSQPWGMALSFQYPHSH